MLGSHISTFPHKVDTPLLDQRVRQWNLERNGLEFSLDLEVKMLSEEVSEFFKAPTLIDRIDAYLDFMFVSIGTTAKYFAVKHPNFTLFQKMANEVTELFEWMSSAQEVMYSILYDELIAYSIKFKWNPDSIDEFLEEAFVKVVEANERKPKEKDADGKVIKGENFMPPEEAIEMVLLKYSTSSVTGRRV